MRLAGEHISEAISFYSEHVQSSGGPVSYPECLDYDIGYYKQPSWIILIVTLRV